MKKSLTFYLYQGVVISAYQSIEIGDDGLPPRVLAAGIPAKVTRQLGASDGWRRA